MFKFLTDHRGFYPKLLSITLPIFIQNLVMSSMNFLDVLMVGQLGPVPIAGVGIANQISFIYIMLIFGIASGVGIFTAQYWGKLDISGIRAMMGLGLVIGMAAALMWTAGIGLFPEYAIRLFSRDPAVISLGGGYLRIACLCYPITSIVVILSVTLRSTEHVKVAMVSTLTGICLNSALNYCLIFGNLGFPEMGAQGAAIATLIAWSSQLCALLAMNYGFKLPTATRWKELWAFNLSMLQDYAKTCLPVVIHDLVWVLGISVYHAIFARISTDAVAAFNVAASIEKVGILIFVALGSACGIMVGNRIGAGQEDKAQNYALKFLFLGVAGAIPISVLLLLLRTPVINLYQLEEPGITYAGRLLAVMAAVLCLKVVNILINMGILRAGGDTKFSMYMDAGGTCLIGVPLGLIAAFVLHLPVYWVVAFIYMEEGVTMVIGLSRIFSGKWLRNLVREKPAL